MNDLFASDFSFQSIMTLFLFGMRMVRTLQACLFVGIAVHPCLCGGEIQAYLSLILEALFPAPSEKNQSIPRVCESECRSIASSQGAVTPLWTDDDPESGPRHRTARCRGASSRQSVVVSGRGR